MRPWVALARCSFAGLLILSNVFVDAIVGSANADELGQSQPKSEIEFLRFGRPLSEQPATVSRSKTLQYEKAIRRPDGPTQCAQRNAAGAIDVSKGLDWTKVEDTRDIEICIFFAAAELQDVELTDEFLWASGFGSIDRIPETPVVTQLSNIVGYGLILNGGMPIEKVPFRIKGLMGSLLAYSLTVSISLDEAERPYHSHSNLNTL